MESVPSRHWSLRRVSGPRRRAADRNKRGKTAVIVLSVAEYQRLTRGDAAKTRNLVDQLLDMPQDDGSFERGRVKPRNVDL